MKTAIRPDNLEILGHLLQAGLQSKLSAAIPVQVRCLNKEETLVILVQHRADLVPDPQQVFDFLEQTILDDYETVSPKVKIYLRVAGQKQPYMSHSFTMEPVSESTEAPTPEAVPDVHDISGFPTDEPADSNWRETDSAQNPNALAADSASLHPWDEPITGTDEGVAASEASLDDLPSTTAKPGKAKSKQALLPLIVAGIGLSVVVFSASFYALSRPCVIGGCRTIPEAEKLSQKSAKTFQKPESGKEVLEAQEQLTDAIELLESIPFWSRYHAQAQELIKAYEAQAERVEDMVKGLKTAARAAYKTANPPHPASQWIEAQTLWREAIAQLEQLPTDRNLKPLAKQKIKDYKLNLAATNQRLVKERQAQGYVQAAKDAALIAQARQGVAQTLPHWQLVYATWQIALKRLKQIPQGTMAYEEAKQLTAQYLPKMAIARDKKTQEQIAANAYKQGVRLAQLAINSQENNQWSAAVTNWRNALTYTNQVPNGTFYYSKAQLLAKSYTGALNQAQGQLQVAMKLQQTRKDLTRTCYGKTQICNYVIDNNVIKVRLTPAYLEMVRQSAIAAQLRGDSRAQTGVVNHILTLGEALAAISDNAKVVIEVYNADGSLIETHSPRR